MKINRFGLIPSAVLAVTSLCLTAHAATPNVDAGSLLRQNEQDSKALKPAPKASTTPAKPAPQASADEPTVLVQGFQFAGNTLLGTDQLNKAVAAYAGRDLTVTQLKEVADVVMNTYRQAGWTARAFLPKQEIEDGVVIIQVVEAVFGGAVFTGDAPQRIEASRLLNMAEAGLGKGKPLNAAQLDRSLLLMNDLPGVAVAGNLVPGERDGETNLAINATDRALFTGNASADNQGSRSTGINRLSVNLTANSPARLGDALSLNALKTEGSDYSRLSYALPLGFDGWRVGLHASHLNYKVITPEFATLNPYGTATTRGWDASYPLVRSTLKNINLALSYDDKQFDNTTSGTTTFYGMRVYNASLNASLMDQWAGGGVSNANLGLTTGDKRSDTTRYSKLNVGLNRLQSLTESLSLYAAVTAQSSYNNLDSSEKMYLGGATGVRAYPSSEAGGSEGSTFTFELRQRLDSKFTLIGFYDQGRVKVNHDNTVTPAANPNEYGLQGYGLSLSWQALPNADIKLTVAQRMGNNPAASATGMDSDGTKKGTRFWLSTSMVF